MLVIQYYCTQLWRSWVNGQEDRRQMWSKSELGETVSGSGRATCDAISIETDALLLHHRLSHTVLVIVLDAAAAALDSGHREEWGTVCTAPSQSLTDQHASPYTNRAN